MSESIGLIYACEPSGSLVDPARVVISRSGTVVLGARGTPARFCAYPAKPVRGLSDGFSRAHITSMDLSLVAMTESGSLHPVLKEQT